VEVAGQTRQLLQQPEFQHRHRAHQRCFVRQRVLSFGCVMLMILQKTLRSVQLHLNDLLAQLGGEEWANSVTGGGWTQARAKLRHGAFIELNERAIVQQVYGGRTNFEVKRWRGWRVLGIDGSLVRLPNEETLGREFGWVECQNGSGQTSRYVQGELSCLYDVLNHIALEVKLVPWRTAERDLALEHLKRLALDDLSLTDRGYASYEWFAWHVKLQRQFVCRCAAGTFGIVNRLMAENVPGRSVVVKLRVPRERRKEVRAAGLPEEITVRFVTFRLPSGELEVLATSLLNEQLYPTECFYALYGLRWGVETFYDVLKGRLVLENFSGRTVEAVRQDVHATVFLSNLETVITRRAQQRLDQGNAHRAFPAQVNRAVSFHAIKSHVISLLLSNKPVPEVLRKLEVLFVQKPVTVRKGRNSPRKKPSGWVSYRYQRNCRKAVF
jgi:hypothetical protein